MGVLRLKVVNLIEMVMVPAVSAAVAHVVPTDQVVSFIADAPN